MKAIAALFIAVGVWLLLPTGSRRRIPIAAGSQSLPKADYIAAFAGLAVATLMGSPVGIVLGFAAGLGLRWGFGRLGTEDHKARQDEILRQAPDAVDCLASCLAAGAPLWPAMRVVAEAFGEPVGGVLNRAVDRHDLGSSALETFSEFMQDTSLAQVGRVLVRSSESGAALADALIACAQRLREERGTQLEVKAKSVGVRVVAPLTLCFLPAFMLFGVVPIVGSLANQFL